MKKTPLIVSAIALLAVANPSRADDVGRLFFTPQQRAQMDDGKLQNTNPGDNNRVLSVTGIVQRHGGERTVWINNVPQLAGKSDDNSPGSLPVDIPGQSQPVRIKVGEKVLLNPASTEP
ncbi:MAG: hypothetical protein IPM27_10160 [Nitrosomonadales bacterium]|nr:hypothetical protein [Nitrosomonadales bacterium]